MTTDLAGLTWELQRAACALREAEADRPNGKPPPYSGVVRAMTALRRAARAYAKAAEQAGQAAPPEGVG